MTFGPGRQSRDSLPSHRDRFSRWHLAASLLAALASLAIPSPIRSAEPTEELTPELASRSGGTVAKDLRAPTRKPGTPVDSTISDPIAAALDAITRCQERFTAVRDYRCKFVKRERIAGALTSPHVMLMKARSRPHSVYFKFERPNKGREAIFVEGRNKGRVLAHDVGVFKVLAGTMNLDPKGSTAMEDCRHPITEAGIGSLVETVAKHWALELRLDSTVVTIRPDLIFAGRTVTMIESTHPLRRPEFLHHMVRLYIDHEHGLPIRFEAYDWPKSKGAPAELLEEYSYLDLELNVGLTEADFDPSNRAYSFGRF